MVKAPPISPSLGTNTTDTVNVTVTVAGVTSATSSAAQFTYVAAPIVKGVEPTAGPLGGGTLVTITGNNLANATEVKFGATVVSSSKFKSDSDGTIEVPSPAGKAGTVYVTVVTVGGTSPVNSPADEFIHVAAPTVSHVSPAAGPLAGGTTVTITGTGFTGATAVDFGTAAASNVEVNLLGTVITATSPEGTGTVNVTVVTAGGSSHTSSADKFRYAALPTLSSISPTSGSTKGGTTVTIKGTNLLYFDAVHFGSFAVTKFITDTATEIQVKSPQDTGAAGPVSLTVTTAGGTSVPSQFTYTTAAGTGAPTVNAEISAPSSAPLSASPATAPSLGATSTSAIDAALRALLLDDLTAAGKLHPLFEP